MTIAIPALIGVAIAFGLIHYQDFKARRQLRTLERMNAELREMNSRDFGL